MAIWSWLYNIVDFISTSIQCDDVDHRLCSVCEPADCYICRSPHRSQDKGGDGLTGAAESKAAEGSLVPLRLSSATQCCSSRQAAFSQQEAATSSTRFEETSQSCSIKSDIPECKPEQSDCPTSTTSMAKHQVERSRSFEIISHTDCRPALPIVKDITSHSSSSDVTSFYYPGARSNDFSQKLQKTSGHSSSTQSTHVPEVSTTLECTQTKDQVHNKHLGPSKETVEVPLDNQLGCKLDSVSPTHASSTKTGHVGRANLRATSQRRSRSLTLARSKPMVKKRSGSKRRSTSTGSPHSEEQPYCSASSDTYVSAKDECSILNLLDNEDADCTPKPDSIPETLKQLSLTKPDADEVFAKSKRLAAEQRNLVKAGTGRPGPLKAVPLNTDLTHVDTTKIGPIDQMEAGPIDPKKVGPEDPMKVEPTDPMKDGPVNPMKVGQKDPKEVGPIDQTQVQPEEPMKEGPIDLRNEPEDPMEKGATDPKKKGATDPMSLGLTLLQANMNKSPTKKDDKTRKQLQQISHRLSKSRFNYRPS